LRKPAFVFGLILAVLAVTVQCAWAVDLKEYKAKNNEKTILFTLDFSGSAPAEVVSNFQGNFVSLTVPGLKFNRAQLKGDHPPSDRSLLPFFRFLRFVAGDESGQIRFYLGKTATPADVLVEQLDNRINVEITKPLWKLKEGAKPPEAKEPAEEAKPGFIPDEKPAETEPAPPETAPIEPEAGAESGTPEETPPESGAEALPEEPTGTDESAAPEAPAEPEAPAAPETPPAEAKPQDGEIYDHTSVSDLPKAGEEPEPGSLRPSEPSGTEPGMPSATPNHPYTEFDLDKVPVAGIEIRGLPFDEALMKLVGSAGFNVVVGRDVEDTEVNLNFTQKQITLKSALDLLCIAYDLTYTIEGDAIVIKGKPPQPQGPS